MQITDPEVDLCGLTATATTNDPQVRIIDLARNQELLLDTHLYDLVDITLEIDDAIGAASAVLFWGTTVSNGFSTARQVIFPVSSEGFQTYTLDMSAEPGWIGLVDDLRVDPFGGFSNIGNGFTIESIELRSSAP